MTSNHTCEPNTCTCKNGTAVDRCPHDGEWCEVCDEGFSLKADRQTSPLSDIALLWSSRKSKDLCLKNKICTCDKGQPVIGPDCPEDGMNFCQSCDDRRETVQKDGSCLENICWCKTWLYKSGHRKGVPNGGK